MVSSTQGEEPLVHWKEDISKISAS